jgi:hypothetical protein
MANALSPLSSTVRSVFDAFIENLAKEQVLEPAALQALKENLIQQKLDAASLRKAVFTSPESKK